MWNGFEKTKRKIVYGEKFCVKHSGYDTQKKETKEHLSVSKIEYMTENIVAIRCFLLPKTHNSIHNHRLVQISYVIF